MNRLWKQFFGTGLSKVLDDLGAQGEPPANPALLDWLACEFMDSGWDMKHMVRTIVTSATYQQVSTATPELLAADPYNRECARQAPFRLDAELVRDTALSVSGLLVAKIGGPSVKPYQPDGYWENLNFPPRRLRAGHGRKPVSPRALHLVAALVPAPQPAGLRCAEPRGMCRRTQSLEHPAAGARAAERSDLCRSCACLRGRMLRRMQRHDGGADRVGVWQHALQRTPRAEELQDDRALLDKHLDAYRADPAARPTTAENRLRACADRHGQGGARRLDARRPRAAEPPRNHHPVMIASPCKFLQTIYSATRRAFLGADARRASARWRSRLAHATCAARRRSGRGVLTSLPSAAASQTRHLADHGGRAVASGDVRPQAEAGRDAWPADARESHQGTADRAAAGTATRLLRAAASRSRSSARTRSEICELFPHIGSVIDDICLIRSMTTEAINHDPAHMFMNTGSQIAGRPSMGAWVTYGWAAKRRICPASWC